MKDNFLINLMINIQKEYLQILHKMYNIISRDNAYLLLDEIKQFWLKREDKIELIFEYLLSDNNITFFTAITKFDVSTYEEYSLLLCGEYHVFDDPLFILLEISDDSNNEFSEYIYKKSIDVIEDTITLMEKTNHLIWVVPIRLVYSKFDNNELVELSNSYFISMFNGISNIEDFLSKCSTIKDVEKYIIPNIIQNFYLTDIDTSDMTLAERIENVKQADVIKKVRYKNDADLFFKTFTALTIQALHIINLSAISGLIPYIKNLATVRMILNLLAELSNKDKFFKDMSKKVLLYHMIQMFVDVDKFIGINLSEYKKKIDALNIFDKLKKVDFDNNYSFYDIKNQIEEILNDLII
ncbi:MAG: hypothetical protein ACOX56_05975 [Acholeplasmataceae bacterium]